MVFFNLRFPIYKMERTSKFIKTTGTSYQICTDWELRFFRNLKETKAIKIYIY